jgi:teichuronic acid biosynthesis glycosyltransferase TuaC
MSSNSRDRRPRAVPLPPRQRQMVAARLTQLQPDSRRLRVNTLSAPVRVQVVTHLWPTPTQPEYGVFVQNQVEALRRPGVEIEVRAFPRGALSYVRAAWALRGSSRSGEFDIVHAHYGLSGWSALASRARRLVVTFHGTDLRHPIVRRLSRALVHVIGLPATVSSSLARAGVPGAGSRRAVAVLPCGIDMTRFRQLDRTAARSRLGLDPDGSYILFPADPARPVKRHDRAAGLAARFPDAELLSLRSVPPPDVPLWINASNAVLVTSDSEGFGLGVLEALACDVPVLATPVGIAPLVLRGLEGTLCAPFDEQRWEPLLRAHLHGKDPRVDGRARAALFSSDRMADRVLAAYRDLMG